MTPHVHSDVVAGCYRCELAADEVDSVAFSVWVVEECDLSHGNYLLAIFDNEDDAKRCAAWYDDANVMVSKRPVFDEWSAS